MTLPSSNEGAPTDRRPAWVERAWQALIAQPELSMRPQRWAAPLPNHTAPPPPTATPRVVVLGMSSDYGNGLLIQLLRLGVVPAALVTSTRFPHAVDDTFYAKAAKRLGVPLAAYAQVNAPAALRFLRDAQPDVGLVFSFDQIFRAELLGIPRLGLVNFHPSLLPHYRGPEPLFWQIADRVATAGLTASVITEGIDEGPILGQIETSVRPDDTAGRLTKRIVRRAAPLLDDVVTAARSDRLAGRPPDLSTGSYQHGFDWLALDWRRPAAALEALVRAGSPDHPPGFTHDGQRYVVRQAQVVPETSDAPPGTVLASGQRGLVVATGTTGLQLTSVAPQFGTGTDRAEIPAGTELPLPEVEQPAGG